MSPQRDHRPRNLGRNFRMGDAGQVRRDVDAEMQFHLDSRVADLCREGLTPAEARAKAELEFGDLQASSDELSRIDLRVNSRRTRAEWLEGWQQDFRLAIRGIRRRPGFAATVIATLALGIAAATSVFSLANATLLQPLPYRDADRLVHVWETRLDNPADQSEASFPNLRDWRNENHSFVSLEGYNQTNLTLDEAGATSRVRGVRVTPGFLGTLGVTLALGRDLTPQDEQQQGGAVVIVTNQFWRQQLGARPGIIGEKLLLDGTPHTVIGVLPQAFHFTPAQDAAMVLPVQIDARMSESRGLHWINVIGRVRDGVPLSTAQQDLAAIMRQLAERHPESNELRTVISKPLREVIFGDVQPLLLLLLAAAGLVLLIACVNVAGLLLSRSTKRAQELAVRGALGASRARMARTLLTESVVLASLGGTLGVALSFVGVHLLTLAIPEQLRLSVPMLHEARVDGAALLVSALATILCGAGAGLLPALNAGRPNVASLMRQGARNIAGNAGRARTALIVAEIALTMVLLVGTGLLGRSMMNLLNLNLGFDAEHVLTGRIALAGSDYESAAQQQRFFEELMARVRSIPGVELVGAISNPPLNGGTTGQVRVEGEAEPTPAKRPVALIRAAGGDYFATLRIPLLDGRTFLPADDSTHPQVAIISAALARQLFHDASAIGRQFQFYFGPQIPWTIVGVVADVKTAAMDQPAPPTLYLPHLQSSENRMSLVVRGMGDPAALGNRVREVARSLDARMPIYAMETMNDRIQRMPEVSSRRFPLVLIGAFSASALLLAVVGIYGLVAQVVSGRTREFGIRRALGAGSVEVMSLVLRHGLTLAGAGILAGGIAATLLTQFMQTLLFGVPRLDVFTYANVVLLMLGFALLASLIPARRAASVDPALALRADD